jgi:hypothetical protein
MRAAVAGKSKGGAQMRSAYVIIMLGSKKELAVDGVANTQLSRGEDGERKCFGVASSDSASHMPPASSANSSSTSEAAGRNRS